MKWLAVLAVCAAMSSSGAYAHFDGALQPCDNQPPPSARNPISVPVAIFDVPGSQMFSMCHKQPQALVIYGCTFLPSPGHTAEVLLNADQDPKERACTLLYEEAHLPPNNWLDVTMEAATPDAAGVRKALTSH